MRVSLEILKPGDSVFSVWDSHVAVKKPSGEVEIFHTKIVKGYSSCYVRQWQSIC